MDRLLRSRFRFNGELSSGSSHDQREHQVKGRLLLSRLDLMMTMYSTVLGLEGGGYNERAIIL